ncbi:MAG: RNA recognition motif domain-containing protein [Calditrichia bacterium]
MNIYIGNLSREVDDNELRAVFEDYGKVDTATIIRDRFTGESRGFGFVEMPVKTEAEEAMSKLDSADLKGRKIIVNEARPRKENRNRGSRHRY